MTRTILFTLILSLAAQTQIPPAPDKSAQSWFGGTNRSRSGLNPAAIPMQPLAQQIRRLESALVLLGQPLDQAAQESIDKAISLPDEAAGKPIQASQASAQWALTAVRQCWSQKAARISAAEMPAARAAYDQATAVYERLLAECAKP